MASGSDAIPPRRALITGAGSGTGAATAVALAPTHELVLVGRRRDRLKTTADRVRAAGGGAEVAEFDVAHGYAASLLQQVGPVTDLVLAAGLNRPRRMWNDLDPREFRDIVATNLLGVADVIAAFLPGLRRAGGTVVVVSSLSAWTTSPGAGVAYRSSKMALRAVTESLNEQEFEHGVRATHLCPGDIDTEFLEHRPAPPSDEQRRTMLSPDDVARAVAFVLASPPHVRIDELVISPLGTDHR